MDSTRNDYRGNQLLAAAIVCTIFSTLSFLGRVWGRRLSAMTFGWEDLLMTVALFGCWSITAVNITGLHYGSGRHIQFVSPSNIINFGITLFVFLLLQTITTAIIKIAILIFYWRTFPTPRFQRIVIITGTVVLLDTIAVTIAVCLFCTPLARFWDPVNVPGHCVNKKLAVALTSFSFLVTDIIIYVMPIPIIWRLKMTTRRKVEILSVFVIGLLVCLSRIVQFVDTVRLNYDDILWSNVDVAIWNLVESHIGFLVANIPFMGPLITLFVGRARTVATMLSSSQSRSERPLSSPHALGSIDRVEFGFKRMDEEMASDRQLLGLTRPGMGKRKSSIGKSSILT